MIKVSCHVTLRPFELLRTKKRNVRDENERNYIIILVSIHRLFYLNIVADR